MKAAFPPVAKSDATGSTVAASQVDYNGHPTGYTASPIEAINYVSVHDGQTLFDAIVAARRGYSSHPSAAP